MAVVTIFPDQHFRQGLLATPSHLPQPIRSCRERSPLRRHTFGGGTFEDVACLAFQGAIVQQGALLEPVHHVIVELPHTDRCHRQPSNKDHMPISGQISCDSPLYANWHATGSAWI